MVSRPCTTSVFSLARVASRRVASVGHVVPFTERGWRIISQAAATFAHGVCNRSSDKSE